MKTLFYERTAYNLSQEPVPSFFFKLDDHFDTKFETIQQAYTHPAVILAEMLCSRMADIELYAYLLNDARARGSSLTPHAPNADIENLTRESHSDAGKGAILMRTYFIGYLAACKALLDTAAYVLTELYDLPLERSDHFFENTAFWHQLVLFAPNVHRRYHSRRLFFNEIIRWRDEAVERIPPIALLQGHLMTRSMQMEVINTPGERLSTLAANPLSVQWRDPIDLHRTWKHNLLDLCERICRDIEEQTV